MSTEDKNMPIKNIIHNKIMGVVGFSLFFGGLITYRNLNYFFTAIVGISISLRKNGNYFSKKHLSFFRNWYAKQLKKHL
jgi:hypothetical protein